MRRGTAGNMELFEDAVPVYLKSVEYKKFVLEATEILSENQMIRNNLSVDIQFRKASLGATIKLRTWILSSPHRELPVMIEEPINWFEHFKRDCLPMWLRRWDWFVPRLRVRTVAAPNNIFVCPHIDKKLPDKTHFEFMSHGSEFRIVG